MQNIESVISPYIASQLPGVYREEGPMFVSFLKAYYEWMEEEGETLHKARRLTLYRDIDATLDEFVNYFRLKYMAGVPEIGSVTDKRMIQKHIKEIYSSKGTIRGLKLALQLLSNESAEVYLPGDDILKPSDGRWSKPYYLEISSNPLNILLVGEQVLGRESGATATVEDIQTRYVNSRKIDILYLSNIHGTFKTTEFLIHPTIYPNILNGPKITGSLSGITMDLASAGSGYKIGDIVDVIGGSGSLGSLVVSETTTRNGIVEFTVVAGGGGYSGFHANGSPTLATYYGCPLGFIAGITGTSSSGATLITGVSNVTDVIPGQVVTGTSGLTVPGGTTVVAVTSSPNTITLNTPLTGGGTSITFKVAAPDTNDTVAGNTWANNVITIDLQLAGVPSGTSAGVGNDATFVVGEVSNVETIGATSQLVISPYASVQIDAAAYGFNPGNPLADRNTSLANSMIYAYLEVGTIKKLKGVNPGTGYNRDVIVTVKNPVSYAMRLPSGSGDTLYKGNNAIVSGIASFGTGLIADTIVLDSGFGYIDGEDVTLAHRGDNVTVPLGTLQVRTSGKGVGSWADTRGFLNADKYIQDSYYYQEYSYEVQVVLAFERYADLLKGMWHPAGVEPFGKVVAFVREDFASAQDDQTSALVIY